MNVDRFDLVLIPVTNTSTGIVYLTTPWERKKNMAQWVLLVMKTLEESDEWYIVIKAFKFTVFEILRFMRLGYPYI